MDLTTVQDFFKNEIEKGNYEIVNFSAPTGLNLWIDILVLNRPFKIVVNEFKVNQNGDISENYIQLGNFTQQQHKTIYEREKKRRVVRND